MKLAGKVGTQIMMRDQGFKVPWSFMNYNASMVDAELKQYTKLANNQNWPRHAAKRQYISWLEYRQRHFKVQQLIGIE